MGLAVSSNFDSAAERADGTPRTGKSRAVWRVRRIAAGVTISLWAGAVMGAFAWQQHYEATAGQAAVAPMDWPGGSALPFHAGRYNLLLFVHPRCPCSRATLSELARLVSQAGASLDTRVLVLQYAGDTVLPSASPLYRQAAGIAHVGVQLDPQARLAKQFHAACSGQALLYSPDGQLIFSGGITPARGQEGDNAGEAAVLRLVHAPARPNLPARRPLAASSAVFGCPLFSPDQEASCHR